MIKRGKAKAKVGRPKLADKSLKNKSIIFVFLCLTTCFVILLTGLYRLNIFPKFNKLKGNASTTFCDVIPDHMKKGYVKEDGTINEYGFDDVRFYSAVISSIHENDNSYCQTTSIDEIKNITSLEYMYGEPKIINTNGIEYMENLKYLDLHNNLINKIDLTHNTKLWGLDLAFNSITEITGLENLTELTNIDLNSNYISSINLQNAENLDSIDLRSNKNLSNIILNPNIKPKELLYGIDTSNNKEDSYSNESIYPTLTNFENIDFSNVSMLSAPASFFKSINYDMPNLRDLYLYGNTQANIIGEKKLSNVDIKLFDNKSETLDFDKLESPYLASITLLKNNLSNIKILNANAINSIRIYSDTDYNVEIYDANALRNIYFAGNMKSLLIHDAPNITIGGTSIGNPEVILLKNTKLMESWLSSTTKKLSLDNVVISDYQTNSKTTINGNSYKNIEDLELKNMNSINEIEMNYGNLKNISIYDCLQLKNINLANNKLEYFDFDGNSKELSNLNLSNNKLKEVNNLKDLRRLAKLLLSNNEIESITLPISSSIHDLNLSDNKIKGELDLSIYENTPIEDIYLYNNELTKIKLPKKSKYSSVYLKAFNNKLTQIDFNGLEQLKDINIANNKLERIDLKGLVNLEYLQAPFNNISKIDNINDASNLKSLLLSNNNFESFAMNNNINLLLLNNNPMFNDIYLAKNEKINYSSNIKLNSNQVVSYDAKDDNVITIDNKKLTAKNVGNTKVLVKAKNVTGVNVDIADEMIRCYFIEYTDNCDKFEDMEDDEKYSPYFAWQNVKVYELTSDIYNIDASNKTIDVSGNIIDASKIILTSNGLKGLVEGNNYVIYDGDKKVVTYTILNPGEITNDKSTVNNITSKKKSKKASVATQSSNDEDNIFLEGYFVSKLTLEKVFDKNKNIIVQNNDSKFIINGKDIKSKDNNIDLTWNAKKLSETNIYNDVKNNIKKGILITYDGDYKGKIYAELTIKEKLLDEINNKFNIYKYDDGKLTLVAENVSLDNGKVKYFMNELGKYVLSSSDISSYSKDENLIKETKNIKKDNNHVVYIVFPLLIILIIIGIIYVIREKKKTS